MYEGNWTVFESYCFILLTFFIESLDSVWLGLMEKHFSYLFFLTPSLERFNQCFINQFTRWNWLRFCLLFYAKRKFQLKTNISRIQERAKYFDAKQERKIIKTTPKIYNFIVQEGSTMKKGFNIFEKGLKDFYLFSYERFQNNGMFYEKQ